MTRTLTVPSRFNGPPGSANGGWVAGAVAAHVATDGPVTVTLVGSPPLDTALGVVATEVGVELRHGDDVLVRAAPADGIGEPVPAVDPATAAVARARYVATEDLPYSTCFVCGTDRPDDGLHVFAGPVEAGDWSRVAATVVADPTYAARPEYLWAVLDCPSGYAAGLARSSALLAGYTVRVLGPARPGETLVLVAADLGPRGSSGRARASRSAAYGDDGRLLAHADAVWVTPRPL